MMLLGTALALRLVGFSPAAPPPLLVTHSEARQVAVREQTKLAASRSELSPEALGGARVVVSEDPAPAPVPQFHPWQPDEWVSLMERELRRHDAPIAHAALWIATGPVRVDLAGRGVQMSVRVVRF